MQDENIPFPAFFIISEQGSKISGLTNPAKNKVGNFFDFLFIHHLTPLSSQTLTWAIRHPSKQPKINFVPLISAAVRKLVCRNR